MFGYDVFGAPISGFSNTPSDISLYDLLRAKNPESFSDGNRPIGWAYDATNAASGMSKDVNPYLVSDGDFLGNNSDKYADGPIAKMFHNDGQSTITNADQLKLYAGDAFEFKARAGTVAKFKVEYINNKGGNAKTTYDYVVNIKKNSISVPTACDSSSSSYSAWSNYSNTDTTSGASGVTSFEVELDGDSGSYLGIDMDRDSSNVHASRFKTANGTWQTNKSSPVGEGINRVQIKLLSITKKPVTGCNDAKANNYDTAVTDADNSVCTYTTTTITSFTANPGSVKVGDPITLKWELASDKFSKVSIIHDGTDLLAGTNLSQAQNSSTSFTPTTVGSNSFKLEVTWDKPNTSKPKLTKSVNVQSATSFIQCTDSNRTKDTNNECSDCKTGYFLDSTTGLCAQCSDPNRSKNTDGSCGDCIDRYELVADICQPIAGGNDCTDSNRETNADKSCASSCKSGYSFDSSNYCQKDSGTASTSSLPLMGILGGVGLLSILAIMA